MTDDVWYYREYPLLFRLNLTIKLIIDALFPFGYDNGKRIKHNSIPYQRPPSPTATLLCLHHCGEQTLYL